MILNLIVCVHFINLKFIKESKIFNNITARIFTTDLFCFLCPP